MYVIPPIIPSDKRQIVSEYRVFLPDRNHITLDYSILLIDITMRRFIYFGMTLCGLSLMPATMNGQSLKDILKSDAVKNAVTSVTGGQAVTAEHLRGTWVYEHPALRLEGDNALKNVAGSLASTEVENKLKEYCEKVGIVEGVFNYVFNEDGTFTSALKRGSLKGTYTVNEAEKSVTFQYTIAGKSLGFTTMTADAILAGDELTLLFNADKLLSFLSTVSSITGSSTLQAINKLASEYDGMQVGFQLRIDN